MTRRSAELTAAPWNRNLLSSPGFVTQIVSDNREGREETKDGTIHWGHGIDRLGHGAKVTPYLGFEVARERDG